MNEAQPFGQWLKARRRALDLTREDLAEQVGCASVTITKIERGQRRPSRQVAERIAVAIGLHHEEQAAFMQWARGVPDSAIQTLPQPSAGEVAQSPAPTTRPDNLPASITSFIGRDHELAKVRAILWRVDARLLTLTGAPGIGKTRLSLTVAAALHDDFEHGVWFVPLAAISDPALVASTIAQTMGLKETAGASIDVTLRAYLRDKQMLLVLDNFEQVVDAGPVVSSLLEGAPRVKMLVTSRAPLHVYGEHEFPVPPLSLPDLGEECLFQRLAENPAVMLFAQRAQAVNPDFELNEENVIPVAEICVGLDGLPLAIELAAARSKLFTPQTMLPMLAKRLALLVEGPRDRADRQRTLRGAIGWSYDLLDEKEQQLFRRLAVFVGGFTLDAAQAVGNAPGTLSLDISNTLASLVDRSLLRPITATGERARHGMLETIREYGLEQLSENGEAEVCAASHAAYHLALVDEAESHLLGPEQGAWLKRLDVEHDNIRAALAWALERGEGELALRLAGPMWRFWSVRGYITEGRGWLERALAAAPTRTGARAKAANGVGNLVETQGDYMRGLALQEESLSIYRELEDQLGASKVLNNLGLLMWRQGKYAEARALFEELLPIKREVGDKWGIAAALANLGMITTDLGDTVSARKTMEESASLFREIGDQGNLALVLNNIGVLALAEGQHEEARALWTESLATYRQLGSKAFTALLLGNLAAVERDQGNFAEALALNAEALPLCIEVGERRIVAQTLDRMAGMAAMEGQAVRSAQLYGAAEALLEALSTTLPPLNQADHDRWSSAARKLADAETFVAAWARGKAMSMQEAVALALSR